MLSTENERCISSYFFGSTPCFRAAGAELRETMISTYKPADAADAEQRLVLYKGPFQQVADDQQRVYRRGERVAVPRSVWESLQQGPLAEQFVCFAMGTDAM